jgi:DNA-binding transcriptional LysR family regulator
MTRRPGLGSRIGRKLKLRDLHILSAVVECGSMSKGGVQLGLSQPVISDAIANLEGVIGVRLLDRTPRGVEPTIYGQALLKRGRVAFDELHQGLQEIEHLIDPTVGEVRLACPESLSAGFVSMIVDSVTRKHPRICVNVVGAQTAKQEFRELHERNVDLMLGRLLKPFVNEEEVNMEILRQDHFVVAAGSASPWATRKRIRLKDLIDEQWILYPPSNIITPFVDQIFRGTGLEPPKATVATFSMHLTMHLLSTGRFLTIVQDSVARYHTKRWSLKVLPVAMYQPPAPIVAFTLKNRTISPVVRVFLEHARAVARSVL